MLEKKIITYSLALYLFLLPLFFLPLNFEIFEFNKTLLTFFTTIIILSVWISACLRTKRFYIATNFVSWGIVAFSLSQLISTLTSVDKYLSIWGYYSRFHQSILHVLAYLTLYHAAITWTDKKHARFIIKL